MAATDRQPPAAVSQVEALLREPHRFDFRRAMRVLECGFPERPRLGRSVRPGDDAVRLGQKATMAFPAGALADFRPSRRGRHRGVLRVFLLGLLGPNGPLPLHLTEYVLDRVRRANDDTLQSFLDLFHHRILSLFWRACANARPGVELDRAAQDRFAGYFGALAGYKNAATGDADSSIDQVRRHWIGHFSRQVRNPEGLQALVAGYFGTAARVEEFVGRWLPMPGGVRCRLGAATGTALGGTAFLGDSIWDCSQTIRIVIGPLDLEHYERMLPGGDSWTRLAAMVRSYVGFEVAWEVRLVLRRDEVPTLRLTDDSHLGWTSWLGAPPPRRDPDDLLLQPDCPYRHHSVPRSRIES